MTTWKELDTDEIIEKLGETKKLDSEIFEYLSGHDDYEVREKIAKRLDTPKEILIKLSKDEDDEVVTKVVKNPNAPLDVIEKIRKKFKRFPDVIDAIICRELPEDWRFLENDEIIDKLSSEIIPNEVLEVLSNLDNTEIKGSIAENKSTSVEILKKLSKDDNFGVLEAVVNNPNTPSDLKKNLLTGDFREYYEFNNESSAPVDIKLNFDEKKLKEIKLFFDQESIGDGGDIYESSEREIGDDEYGVDTDEVSSKSVIIWAMPRCEDEYKIKIEYRYYSEKSEIIMDVSIGSYDMKIGLEKEDLIPLDMALGEFIDNGGKLSDINAF